MSQNDRFYSQLSDRRERGTQQRWTGAQLGSDPAGLRRQSSARACRAVCRAAAAVAVEAEAEPLPGGLGWRRPRRRCEQRRSWIPLYRCGRARPSCQLRCPPASASSCRGCAPLFQSVTQPTQPPVSVRQAGARVLADSRSGRGACWQRQCLAAVRAGV
jgi:hypothetical protein